MENLLDLGVACLFICAVISTFGFLLFAWEWRRKRAASTEFKYITLVFLFLAYSQWLQFYARVNSILNPKGFEVLLASIPWQIRNAPLSIVIGLICWRMIKRVNLNQGEEK